MSEIIETIEGSFLRQNYQGGFGDAVMDTDDYHERREAEALRQIESSTTQTKSQIKQLNQKLQQRRELINQMNSTQ